jgi:hypothetical protein
MTHHQRLLKVLYRFHLERLENADYVKTEKISKVLHHLSKRMRREHLNIKNG